MIDKNETNDDVPNRETWWGQDATRILDYIEMYRGNMSDFEVLEDVMCGSYVDEPDLYEDEPTPVKGSCVICNISYKELGVHPEPEEHWSDGCPFCYEKSERLGEDE